MTSPLRYLCAVLATVLAVAPVAYAAPAALPAQPDPDVPAITAPVAAVTVFDHEYWSLEEGAHATTFVVPDVAYDRVVMTFSGAPDTNHCPPDSETCVETVDPWDRLFGVSLAGVEVMRGTTPRAAFTVRRDLTRYASLLRAGDSIEVAILLGTWVGAQNASLSLDFYANEPTVALVEAARDAVVPSLLWRGLHGSGDSISGAATFPDGAPAAATIEILLSGHGQDGEFWMINNTDTRVFHVAVDGREVATVTAMPYVYALAGLSGSRATGTINPLVWWTAPQALDIAGAHVGIGEIPAYRASLEPADVALLTGARTVTVAQEGGDPVGGSDANWVTSVHFVFDDR